MKYPIKCKNIIDVTKAPYLVDNTGKADCTERLCRSVMSNIDDILIREVEGVEETKKKLYNAPDCCIKERTNVAQMNTIEDLIIDCGSGNPGAVGIRFSASNSGRIENVTLCAQEGYCGIHMAYGAEGSFVNITAEGFDYGVDTFVSSLGVFDDNEAEKKIFLSVKAMLAPEPKAKEDDAEVASVDIEAVIAAEDAE